MAVQSKKFCFCTLALGEKYRSLAKNLAKDLETYSPGTTLVICSDELKDFKYCSNILAFKHQQTGILHCYNDKRFVIAKALKHFNTAIHIDADTRIIADVPEDIEWSPGITGRHRNLLEHVKKVAPERLPLLQKITRKLNIELETADFIGESLYAVTRDGKEEQFIEQWGTIGHYLELQGMHSGDGNVMGLAAAKVGWRTTKDGWDRLNQIRKHLDASDQKSTKTAWDRLRLRLLYHYRLNRSRLLALKHFDFYYR